jgi:hypothetical protein
MLTCDTDMYWKQERAGKSASNMASHKDAELDEDEAREREESYEVEEEIAGDEADEALGL